MKLINRGKNKKKKGKKSASQEVMANLMKQAQEADKKQSGGKNIITWRDMEQGCVVIVDLEDCEFVTEQYTHEGMKHEAIKLEVLKAKKIGPDLEVKKFLEGEENDDGEMVYPKVSINKKYKEVIERELEEGNTCAMFSNHEFLKPDTHGVKRQFHKIAYVFGDDDSHIKMMLEE